MKTAVFSVPLAPVGAARPRVYRGVAFTPAKTKNFEDQVRYYALKATEGMEIPRYAPIRLYAVMAFKVPKSYSKARRENCLNGLERPLKKPDIDNVDKAIMDGLNPKIKRDKVLHKMVEVLKGMYADDKQVVEEHLIKVYDTVDHVDVRIDWLDQPEDLAIDKMFEFMSEVSV